MSKHIRVRYKGLKERRRWAAWKLQQVAGIVPPTLTEARKLWQERHCKLTGEELAELSRRYHGGGLK